ncbi:Dyp-type peroxidase [Streptomyces fulvoviolaceus]|uniref:Dyp-type peroxidase n=1 Tax=Streptomyces fulvoviolaceus TaxID=285535 RepID=UPI0021C0FA81|nr:Dyp-type peroxidase [Streptomyces fulvoviolaceus]MCT9083261.1 Dyp-type peroxidase [Streptomyces fulvoviolaceus]
MSTAFEPEDVQGLIVRGYGKLPYAAFLLLSVEDAAATRALLGRWAREITSGAVARPEAALNIAFTAAGLRAVGLPDRTVDAFAPQFVEGMTTEHRGRLLGDLGPADPKGWLWGGPDNPAVHVLLLVYADTAPSLDRRVTARLRDAQGALAPVMALPTDELGGTEPFGFRDGLSQPGIEGRHGDGRHDRALPAGEFVLGHPNAYGQLGERPLLAPDADPERVLPPDPGGSGRPDLGRDGSYLVLRQLRQDVDAFWSYTGERTRRPDGTPDAAAQLRLAAKMVGRWPSGAPLVLTPDRDDPSRAEEEFGYHADDPDGLRCPLGAHIRRANPRDSQEPRPGTAASLDVTDRHRLLRRGRSYTTEGTPPERGLYFMCLNGDLARQYEFVQHSWINDPAFSGLHDDSDPLIAPGGPRGATFTEQREPVRRRHPGVPAFVQVRGGAYFFLPGVPALRYLSTMPV